MLVGIDFLAVKAAALFRNRRAEAGLPPGHTILIPPVSHRLLGGGKNFLRWSEVREASRQQDRSLVKGITRDGADDGFLKIVKPVGSVSFHSCHIRRSDTVTRNPLKQHRQQKAG